MRHQCKSTCSAEKQPKHEAALCDIFARLQQLTSWSLERQCRGNGPRRVGRPKPTLTLAAVPCCSLSTCRPRVESPAVITSHFPATPARAMQALEAHPTSSALMGRVQCAAGMFRRDLGLLMTVEDWTCSLQSLSESLQQQLLGSRFQLSLGLFAILPVCQNFGCVEAEARDAEYRASARPASTFGGHLPGMARTPSRL